VVLKRLLNRLLRGSVERAKLALIRDLVLERVKSDPLLVDVQEYHIDRMDLGELYGLPEATLLSIVEAYVSQRYAGLDHYSALLAIEDYRGQAGLVNFDHDTTLEEYTQRRIKVEHGDGSMALHLVASGTRRALDMYGGVSN
jgi:hypothetical protein